MRVVLDTNVVVSYVLAPRGAIDTIFTSWRHKQLDFVVSPALLEEYGDALIRPSIQSRHHQSEAQIKALVGRFLKLAIVVNPHQSVTAVSDDPDDNMVLECALEGKANYVITGDAHLLRLEVYRGIPILTPAQFLVASASEAKKAA